MTDYVAQSRSTSTTLLRLPPPFLLRGHHLAWSPGYSVAIICRTSPIQLSFLLSCFPKPYTPRMPDNPCASFVEKRAGPMLMNSMVDCDLDVTIENNIAFVDRYDGFVAREGGPRYFLDPSFIRGSVDLIITRGSDNENLESYKLSQTKMRDFQQTLTRFTETLQKRKVFTKLGIPSRDPRNFDLDYVLSIATRISERRDTDEETRICKRFIRKICQKTTKHKNVLSGLISLAPSDIYGSVISGGFTLILAVSPPGPSFSRFSAHFLSSRLLRVMKNSALRCREL